MKGAKHNNELMDPKKQWAHSLNPTKNETSDNLMHKKWTCSIGILCKIQTAIVNAINRTQWWLRPLRHTSQFHDNNNDIFISASKNLLKKKKLIHYEHKFFVPLYSSSYNNCKFDVYNFSFFILNFCYLSSQNKY